MVDSIVGSPILETQSKASWPGVGFNFLVTSVLNSGGIEKSARFHASAYMTEVKRKVRVALAVVETREANPFEISRMCCCLKSTLNLLRMATLCHHSIADVVNCTEDRLQGFAYGFYEH